MINWFKQLFFIVKNFNSLELARDHQIVNLNNYISGIYKQIAEVKRKSEVAILTAEKAEKLMRDRTDVSADIHWTSRNRQLNTIIIVGRYKGRDFVECYNVDNIEHLVRQLRDMQETHRRHIVDAPPEFKAWIDN
jgi:hypothetical protein